LLTKIPQHNLAMFGQDLAKTCKVLFIDYVVGLGGANNKDTVGHISMGAEFAV